MCVCVCVRACAQEVVVQICDVQQADTTSPPLVLPSGYAYRTVNNRKRVVAAPVVVTLHINHRTPPPTPPHTRTLTDMYTSIIHHTDMHTPSSTTPTHTPSYTPTPYNTFDSPGWRAAHAYLFSSSSSSWSFGSSGSSGYSGFAPPTPRRLF